MKRYYIADRTQPKGFIEVTESEWNALIGTEETRPYTYNVYCGELSIDDVPEELREQVQAIVNNKITRWGTYDSQAISYRDFQNMIKEVL